MFRRHQPPADMWSRRSLRRRVGRVPRAFGLRRTHVDLLACGVDDHAVDSLRALGGDLAIEHVIQDLLWIPFEDWSESPSAGHLDGEHLTRLELDGQLRPKFLRCGIRVFYEVRGTGRLTVAQALRREPRAL